MGTLGFFSLFEEAKLDPNLQLSPRFKVKDLIVTNTGIDNRPPEEKLASFQKLAKALEKVYSDVGPFRIASAYRSPEVNSAVGGSPTSRHLSGEAADITPTSMTAEEFWATILKFPSLKNSLGHISWKKHQNNLHITTPFQSSSRWIQGEAQIADSYGGKILYKAATPNQMEVAINKYFGDPIRTAPEVNQGPVIAAGFGFSPMALGVLILGLTAVGTVIRRKMG